MGTTGTASRPTTAGRSSDTYTTASGAIGFGLPIISEIVEAHGWTMTVAGSEDGGRGSVLVPEGVAVNGVVACGSGRKVDKNDR